MSLFVSRCRFEFHSPPGFGCSRCRCGAAAGGPVQTRVPLTLPHRQVWLPGRRGQLHERLFLARTTRRSSSRWQPECRRTLRFCRVRRQHRFHADQREGSGDPRAHQPAFLELLKSAAPASGDPRNPSVVSTVRWCCAAAFPQGDSGAGCDRQGLRSGLGLHSGGRFTRGRENIGNFTLTELVKNLKSTAAGTRGSIPPSPSPPCVIIARDATALTTTS